MSRTLVIVEVHVQRPGSLECQVRPWSDSVLLGQRV